MKKYRFLFVILTILCIAFIWNNSIATGTESSAFSETVKEMINNILSALGIGGLSEHFVRKLAHFTEFLCLSCLLVSDCILYAKHMAYAPLAGLMVAVADETIQNFSADRSSSVIDVWIDFFGICVGLVVMYIACKAVKKHRSKYPPQTTM